MLEILKVLLDKPLNASLIGARLGIERETIIDMVSDLQAKGFVKESGNKLAITAEGIAAIKQPDGDCLQMKPEVLLPFITEASTCSLIVKKSGFPMETVKALLPKLVESGLAVRYDNGQYKTTTKTIVAANKADKVPEKRTEDKPAKPAVSFDVIDLGSPTALPVPPTVAGALDKLRQKLVKKQIQELPTKLAVLNRLAEILEPSIAEVLTEISADLEAA